MKAISLIQPYATLIMLGYKSYETRSWTTKHRGPLAIAASAGKPKWAREVAEKDPIVSALLAKHSLTFDTLPRGGIVGTCQVGEMNPTDGFSELSDTERACGDYGPRRWAWTLYDVRPLPRLVGCKGALSIWQVPDAIAALVEHALAA
ncbi:ASCH domain-containing protein [Hymenobacter lapidiphilus]|uniref:ASCH domain-containing protein n=1 Tax=Hymenobacter lapidiphilus TaxID=2608003 RepID=A0A7Y7PT05_9BACT|nr:ASCH domain-containing protein [Hymenobacter lapidiphilus]NVO33490.1 ASCH domain-containing protein [Hymenobacter lapidiphilus]